MEKKKKADESPIPIHNLAKLLQSASKIPESTNTQQKSKGNSQIHNGSKLIHLPTKLQTTPSEFNTHLHKCDKVTKVKLERETQPSEHAKRDVKKNAKETNKSRLNIETNPPETTVAAINTGQFVGKAGIYIPSNTKSRATCLQSNGTSGPYSVFVSKSCDVPPSTKTQQLRNKKSKSHTKSPASLEKEIQMEKSSKQEPKLAVHIENCSTKAQMSTAKTPPHSTYKVKSTGKLQKSPTTDYKSSSNKTCSPKNSLDASDDEKNETKSPSILQKILTRVWNFSTKFRKSSTDVEEQKPPATEIHAPEKAEKTLSTSNQKNTSKLSNEQDHLKLNQTFNTTTENLPVSDQQLVNTNKTSTLDVAKCSTETQPAPVRKCKQPEKENPGLVLQQGDRELTGEQHANGIDPIISNDDKTGCPIEQCRKGISCAESRETELELQTKAEMSANQNTS